MARGRVSNLCAVLSLLVLASTAVAANDFYRLIQDDVRRCAPPLCGGYFIEKVNVKNSTVYVAEIDYSLAAEGAEMTVKEFRGALLNAPVVFFGDLIPYPDADFSLDNIKVERAYLGMPGQTADLRGLTFYTIASEDNTASATKLNAPDVSPIRIAPSSVQPVRPAALLDVGWQLSRIRAGRAVVAATLKRSLPLSTINIKAVYIELPVQSSPCPRFISPECDQSKGGRIVFKRILGYCYLPVCIYKTEFCTLSLPNCAEGYQLASWPAPPGGCNQFACDPIFFGEGPF